MARKGVLTRDALREFAGDRSFFAGEAYFNEGAVSKLQADARTITATVRGTERYEVHLQWDDDGDLEDDCTCPYNDEGNFCKPCVAVGLAFLADGARRRSQAWRRRHPCKNIWNPCLRRS